MTSGVTVYTSTEHTWNVRRGCSWDGQPTMTGELAVTVYDSSPGTEGSEPLAFFGSVEVVYIGDEVTLVPPSPARGL